ncbi:pimeloyl-ACP methyl ester carboxylesterase [Sphingomonas naasensis]|uniref:Alpha/beta hydrolase n=1 Tax=Sphingomonas naasensis TaxID=1344951 RepID=A0A4V3QV84_9SPHN|nr:alpha/beta hydrolase [Sphingomonas naasensis]NIJ20664.1 pimeloyl-ACP methyl ester carboxylesterase [Sphingomonas naasensis]TGX37612.1 alpha/beta hydrolase [Sphingomonas naasensis]
MKKVITGGLVLAAGLFAASAQAQPVRPTIVLVHGAFADSSSWNGVITLLERDGYTVIAAPNPLRGVRADADVVADVVKSVPGPVVLVGHSYGGSVISEAAEGAGNVKALVYVSAFAPDTGETALGLTGKFPGSTLGTALAPPVKLTAGGNDLYILQARFHDQFAADVPAPAARQMAAGQRPVAEAALAEEATMPAWKHLPSWFIYGDGDRNIPPAAMGFMAERAKSRQTVVVKGASHVVMVSHAPAVAGLIERAAAAR